MPDDGLFAKKAKMTICIIKEPAYHISVPIAD